MGTRYANITKARRILGFEARIGLTDAVRLSAEAYLKRTGIALIDTELKAAIMADKA